MRTARQTASMRLILSFAFFLPSLLAGFGWVNASSTVQTSLVPLHRQFLREIEQTSIDPRQERFPKDKHHSTGNKARNTGSIILDEYSSILTNQGWSKLDEVGSAGIPLPRRGHSSTIYSIGGKDDGANSNIGVNGTLPDDDRGMQISNFPQEYMIISGGFTAKDWKSFPVWSYDITGAVLTNNGKWERLYDVTAEEELCSDAKGNSTSEVNDKMDEQHLWENAVNCPPQSRYGHISVVRQGYLYVFGGLLYLQQSGVFLLEREPYMYRLNISKPSAWERILPRAEPPPSFNSIADQNETNKYNINRGEVRGGYWEKEDKLIIYGGLYVRDYTSMTGRLQQEDDTLGDVWAYDFESSTWEIMAYLKETSTEDSVSHKHYPDSRTSHAATIVGDELVICGGLKKTNTLVWDGTTVWEQLTDVWIFDLEKRTWRERKMSQKIGRSHHSLVGWKDVRGTGEPIVASFGGYKTVYDAMSSVPRPITFVYDDTLISSSSKEPETNSKWLEIDDENSRQRPVSRREHSAVLSEFGNMLVWGGRLQTTEDDMKGVWSLNVLSSETFYAEDDDEENQALEEFYLLVTTIFFISMMFTYMCGTLARHSDSEMSDGIIDAGSFPGFDSATNPWRSNGIDQDIIDTLPLKTYHNNESVSGNEQVGQGRLHPTPVTSRDEGQSNEELDLETDDEACCAICLVPYKDGDELRSLPCGHEFHKLCVDSWLGNSASCPTCRYSLQDLTCLSMDASHAMSWARISNLTLLGSNSAEEEPESRGRLSSLMQRLRFRRHGSEILRSSSDASNNRDSNNPSDDFGLSYPSSIEMTEDISSRSSAEGTNNVPSVGDGHSIDERTYEMEEVGNERRTIVRFPGRRRAETVALHPSSSVTIV